MAILFIPEKKKKSGPQQIIFGTWRVNVPCAPCTIPFHWLPLPLEGSLLSHAFEGSEQFIYRSTHLCYEGGLALYERYQENLILKSGWMFSFYIHSFGLKLVLPGPFFSNNGLSCLRWEDPGAGSMESFVNAKWLCDCSSKGEWEKVTILKLAPVLLFSQLTRLRAEAVFPMFRAKEEKNWKSSGCCFCQWSPWSGDRRKTNKLMSSP